MKDLKLINKEINEIMSSIKDENSDSFSIIRKSKDALLAYYSKNKDEIEKDALLKKYKALTYDNESMNSYVFSLLIGIISSILFKFLFDNDIIESLFEGVTRFLIVLLITIIICVLTLLITVSILNFIKKMHDDLLPMNYFYINKFHAKIIEKILMENGIYVNDDIENIDLDIYKNDSVSKE